MYRCLHVLILMVTSIIIYPDALLAQKPTVVGGDPIINIDANNNSGSTQLHLRNDSRNPMSVFLHASSFFSQMTSAKLRISGEASFRQADTQTANRFFELELPPDHSLFVILEVSKFVEAGEGYAYLFDREDTLAIIRVVKFNVPFNVGLDAADPNLPELSFQRNREGLLIFKNEDSMTYKVYWSLLLPGEDIILGQDTTLLPGRSTTPILFNPPRNAFKSWFSSFFKDRMLEGRMVMRFAPSGDVGQLAPITRTMPVKAKMQYWPGGLQVFVSYFVILILLGLGALLSLFLNLVVPNRLRRLGLLRRIDRLARKTELISRKIDSSLRVEARAESFRLVELVKSVGPFNTDALSILENYKNSVDLLDQRFSIIQELDAVMDKLDNLRGRASDAPPKILDEVGKKLDEATRLMKLPIPNEITFKQAQENIRGADERLGNIAGENQLLAEQLAKFVGDLIEKFSNQSGRIGGLAKCKELREMLKGLFDLLDKPEYKNKSAILPVHYHWISSTTERLFILRHYIRDWEEANQKKRDLMKIHEDELLNYLRSRTWKDLHRARRLRIAMWEEIYEDTIENALVDKDFSISWIPILPFPNQPVRMEVKFNSDRLNSCMARHDFKCIWDFGKKIGKEEGWQISHYFRNKEEGKFKVRFIKPDGRELNKNEIDAEEAQEVQLRPQPREKDERLLIEMARTTVAVVVAILGLIAGARQELMKLDVFSGLVGVFLIGFAADTVKNLITKRSEDVA